MDSFKSVKERAKALRKALVENGISATHSQCLEEISRQHGFPDWNSFSMHLNLCDLKSLQQRTRAALGLHILIADSEPVPIVEYLVSDDPESAVFDILYDSRTDPGSLEYGSLAMTTRIPINGGFSWADAMKFSEKSSPEAAFLFHPPLSLWNEIIILCCCRPTFLILIREEWRKLEEKLIEVNAPQWSEHQCSRLSSAVARARLEHR